MWSWALGVGSYMWPWTLDAGRLYVAMGSESSIAICGHGL